jgi:P27 family predicted phage terminase small subunit
LLQVKGRKPNIETIANRLKQTGDPNYLPECPDFVSPMGQEEWARVIPELARHYTLSPIDVNLLTVYCETFAQWKLAAMTLRLEGMIVGGKTHPLCKQYNALAIELRRLANEFGFTPASRGRIDPKQAPGEDGANDLVSFNALN